MIPSEAKFHPYYCIEEIFFGYSESCFTAFDAVPSAGLYPSDLYNCVRSPLSDVSFLRFVCGVQVEIFLDLSCPDTAAAWPTMSKAVEEWDDSVEFIYRLFPLPYHHGAFTIAQVRMQLCG